VTSPDSAPSRTDGERDAAGRFQPGNVTSRKGGNPRLRNLGEHQDAIRAAFGPEDVVRVLSAMRDRALDGDVGAAATWLGRVAGNARTFVDASALPRIAKAADFAEAARSILGDVAEGRLDLESAQRLLDLARGVADAVALQDLEARLAVLELRR
jgi:hypothetical protein